MSGNLGIGLGIGNEGDGDDGGREGPRELFGDVTGPPEANIVATVGGQTAAAVANAVKEVGAATNTNIASTLVQRDPNGGIAVGAETAASLAVGAPPATGAQPGQILSPMWRVTGAISYMKVSAATTSGNVFASGPFSSNGGSLKICVFCSAYVSPSSPPGGIASVDVILANSSGSPVTTIPGFPTGVLGTLMGTMNNNTVSIATPDLKVPAVASPAPTTSVALGDGTHVTLSTPGTVVGTNTTFPVPAQTVTLVNGISVTLPAQFATFTGATAPYSLPAQSLLNTVAGSTQSMHITLVPMGIFLTGTQKPPAGSYTLQLRVGAVSPNPLFTVVDTGDFCQAFVEEVPF
jgi:hypothetical protein